MECKHSHISPPVPALSLLQLQQRFTMPWATRRAHHSPSSRHCLAPLCNAISRLGGPLPLRPVDPLPAEHGRGRSHLIELVGRNGQRIAVEHDQIGQLAGGDRALPVLAAGDVGAAEGIGAERLLRGQGLGLFAQVAAGRRRAIDRGVHADPGVVVGDIRVGRSRQRDAGIRGRSASAWRGWRARVRRY